LKGSWGIAKIKGRLPKGIRAKRACECGLLLVFRGNENLGVAEVPTKKAIKIPSRKL